MIIDDLSHCQIIDNSSTLYNDLDNMTEQQFENLRAELIERGCHILYNSLDDVFVVA